MVRITAADREIEAPGIAGSSGNIDVVLGIRGRCPGSGGYYPTTTNIGSARTLIIIISFDAAETSTTTGIHTDLGIVAAAT